MPKLTEPQKTLIVQRLAMYDTPTQVAEAVKEEFGIDIHRAHVAAYDAERTPAPARKWVALFEATRKNFLDTAGAIPIANRSYRLRSLNRMAIAAEKQRNFVLAKDLHEQAAKEMGELYTNRHKIEHTGKDGLPFGGVTVEIHNEEGGTPSVQVIT